MVRLPSLHALAFREVGAHNYFFYSFFEFDQAKTTHSARCQPHPDQIMAPAHQGGEDFLLGLNLKTFRPACGIDSNRWTEEMTAVGKEMWRKGGLPLLGGLLYQSLCSLRCPEEASQGRIGRNCLLRFFVFTHEASICSSLSHVEFFKRWRRGRERSPFEKIACLPKSINEDRHAIHPLAILRTTWKKHDDSFKNSFETFRAGSHDLYLYSGNSTPSARKSCLVASLISGRGSSAVIVIVFRLPSTCSPP